jgi:hypothetical protein
MTPLPAAEVRRRGTRLRRRNNALAAVGGLAVIAAIAAPLAVLAGNQGSSDPDPAPPGHHWVQEVPADYPLAAGLPGAPEVTAEPGAADVELCQEPVWTTDGTIDVAGASYSEGEGQSGRTLAMYADDTAAERAITAIRGAVEACPRDPNGSGVPLVSAPIETDLGGDASFAFSQQSQGSGLLADLTLVEVVRSGNVLYLESAHTSAGGPSVVAQVAANMEARSTEARAGLCLFSASGCVGDQAPDPHVGEGAVPPSR